MRHLRHRAFALIAALLSLTATEARQATRAHWCPHHDGPLPAGQGPIAPHAHHGKDDGPATPAQCTCVDQCQLGCFATAPAAPETGDTRSLPEPAPAVAPRRTPLVRRELLPHLLPFPNPPPRFLPIA